MSFRFRLPRPPGLRLLVPFRIRLRIAQARSLAVRHRVVRRLLGVGLAGFATVVVVTALVDARSAQRQWGAVVDVVVTDEIVATGTDVDIVSFRQVARPVALVPADALRVVPENDRFIAPVIADEIVTERMLASSRHHDLPLPAGTRSVGLAVDAATPMVRIGDMVDLIVVADPFGADAGAPELLRPPAIVTGVDEDTITLAIDATIVGDVVAARSLGRVSLAVR